MDYTTISGNVITFTRDSLGRIETLTYPNGVTANYTYDPTNRVTDILTLDSELTTISSYTYEYDASGNRTSMTDTTGTHEYTYDEIYRLTGATHPTIPEEQFTYDPTGNRLTSSEYSDWNYNNANQLLSYDGLSYEYDANGNMISKTDQAGTTIYTYDADNRLIRADFPDDGYSEYKYDPFGRRIAKDVNGVLTKYVYDRENIVLEYDDTDEITARYFQNLLTDDPLAVETGGQTYYYHKDGLGSIMMLTDSGGNTAETYEYDSFGSIVSQTGAIDQPFTYTGREYDDDTGMYYYRARYYDSEAGRFVSEDPIMFISGVNLYIYVQNNPVNYVDIWGLIRLKPGVDDGLVKNEIKKKYPVIDRVFSRHTDKEAVITSTTGDKHKKGSLHYEGLAIDLRGHYVPDLIMDDIAKELGDALGPDYDVM